MVVQVDHPGHHDVAAGIDYGIRAVPLQELIPTYRRNRAAGDHDYAAVEGRPAVVHGQDMTVGDDQVGGFQRVGDGALGDGNSRQQQVHPLAIAAHRARPASTVT